MKHTHTWNYDKNEGGNLCHKSRHLTNPRNPMYNNEKRNSAVILVATASAICEVKPEHRRFKCVETYEKPVMPYWIFLS